MAVIIIRDLVVLSAILVFFVVEVRRRRKEGVPIRFVGLLGVYLVTLFLMVVLILTLTVQSVR